MQKTVGEKRHYCATCDNAFTEGAKLAGHTTGLKKRQKAGLVFEPATVISARSAAAG